MPPKLKPIPSRIHLGNKAYQHLKEAIIQGSLPPGTPLQEGQLTKSMNISRTPLREALNRLKAEGLVSSAPHKGAWVTEFSPEEWDALFEVREAIETTFFSRSARNLNKAELKRLQKQLSQAERELIQSQGDPAREASALQAYFEVDWAFHDELIAAANNKYWNVIYYNIRERIQICSYQVGRLPQKLLLAVEEHHDILEALLQGQIPEAKKRLRKHIRSARVSLSQALTSPPRKAKNASGE
jgi:DNA-binding GntR family transcriptional regulator